MSGSHFFCDQCSDRGEPQTVCSVIDAAELARVAVLDVEGVKQAIQAMQGVVPPKGVVFEFILRLRGAIESRYDELLVCLQEESGFTAEDNREVLAGIIDYLECFDKYSEACTWSEEPAIPHSFNGSEQRYMQIVSKPVSCVGVMVPQNASLGLAVIALVSALAAGARVIIRPSMQCAASGALLAQILAQSAPPGGCVAVVNCKASDFLQACLASPQIGMVHYIGSDRFAQGVLSESFRHGKQALVDGEGNGMLLIGDDYPLDKACELICSAATRFNGQTCTSVNGVLVSPERLPALQQSLAERFSALRVGDPRDGLCHLGPLFSGAQAIAQCERARDTQQAIVITGGEARGNYLPATLVVNPAISDEMVREGFFGPLVWLAGVPQKEWGRWMAANRFPLSDTLLSNDADLQQWFIGQSRAGRLCFNEDPSIESMFEPWGGYAPAASNPVSHWIHKYTSTVQFDAARASLGAITRLPRC